MEDAAAARRDRWIEIENTHMHVVVVTLIGLVLIMRLVVVVGGLN
jgi:hypothetical protein